MSLHPWSACRTHEQPPEQAEQHAPNSEKREVIDGVIRDFPNVVNPEDLVVNDGSVSGPLTCARRQARPVKL